MGRADTIGFSFGVDSCRTVLCDFGAASKLMADLIDQPLSGCSFGELCLAISDMLQYGATTQADLESMQYKALWSALNAPHPDIGEFRQFVANKLRSGGRAYIKWNMTNPDEPDHRQLIISCDEESMTMDFHTGAESAS